METDKVLAGAVRVENQTPTAYRLARKPNGELVLQGAYQWQQGRDYGHTWRDIQTVKQALASMAMENDKVLALIEAVQQEHGGDITNPKCPICIAINALNEKPIDPNKWAFDRGLESY